MKQSAGILLYKLTEDQPMFFLVHPGGPFFARKDAGWWTIPKGEPMEGEELLHTAIRELQEETGYTPAGDYIPLQPITQKAGKKVHCWAIQGDLDPAAIVSNHFPVEWPPRSGKMKSFPEIDKAGWFTLAAAQALINAQQAAFLAELAAML